MKKIYAKYYIHGASIGNELACQDISSIMEIELRTLHQNTQIEGAEIIVVHDLQEAEDGLVWCDYNTITSDRFPFVATLVQPLQESPIHIDDVMAAFGYTPCIAIDPFHQNA